MVTPRWAEQLTGRARADWERMQREIEEWALLIGRSITAFGEIELVTYKFLALLPKDTLSNTTARLRFSQRIDLLIEIIDGRVERTSDHDAIRRSLLDAKKLAEKRNIMAHNPVLLTIFSNARMDDHLMQRSIVAARHGEPLIDLAEMKELAAACENLAATMWKQMLDLDDAEKRLT